MVALRPWPFDWKCLREAFLRLPEEAPRAHVRPGAISLTVTTAPGRVCVSFAILTPCDQSLSLHLCRELILAREQNVRGDYRPLDMYLT